VENALRVLLALGGSTNALIHLTAIAGRPASKIARSAQRAVDTTPVLVDLKPTGNGYMEDFRRRRHGRAAARIAPLLHLDCMT
jgi:dihydroxy-acid dehydratase